MGLTLTEALMCIREKETWGLLSLRRSRITEARENITLQKGVSGATPSEANGPFIDREKSFVTRTL